MVMQKNGQERVGGLRISGLKAGSACSREFILDFIFVIERDLFNPA